jgi:hypothetical protein
MAAVKPQTPDLAKNAKAAAAASNSVPELRSAVETLSDAVEELQQQVAELQRRSGKR